MSNAQAGTFLEAGSGPQHSSEQGLSGVIGHGVESGALALGMTVVLGWLIARALRRARLSWTWALLGLPAGYLVGGLLVGRWPIWIVSVIAAAKGARLHDADIAAGGGSAQVARSRDGVSALLGSWNIPRLRTQEVWITGGRLTVGRTSRTGRARIPVGEASGKHTLVVGATGSGKTVTQAWIAGRMIESGHGAVVIDPKGDELLRAELKSAAARRGAPFVEWSPEGPVAYNPYARGSATEIADKALAGEQFTEPHYLRQAQRYLGHTVRAMHGAHVDVTPLSLMEHMNPRQLEATARLQPDEEPEETQRYLDELTDRQKRDLSGIRDRLSILAESDVRQWLGNPSEGAGLDIQQAVAMRAVVYFRLESDLRPLLSQILAAAIVSDLITLSARQQQSPVPTLVMIDEFAAVAAAHISKLFGKARTAGISLLLGTQEFADLQAVGAALKEQTIGNLDALVAHRQNVPQSAELIAKMSGTQEAWIPTEQTESGWLGTRHSGKGTRRRGEEFRVHPNQIMQLRTGNAVVLTPGTGTPVIASMLHPTHASP